VIAALLVALWVMFSSGKPAGMSDAQYSQFRQLAPPKILYSCTRKPTRESLLPQVRKCAESGRAGCEQEVYESGEARVETTYFFAGGTGTSTYSDLLQNAKRDCSADSGTMGNGVLKVLEASKN
jgi:hypothetical protein